MKHIAIIWWGAAGMMCAATLLEKFSEFGNSKDFHIHLFEKNPVLGKKVSISGGGRCNITTGITDKKTLLGKYTRGSDFLKYSIGKFWPKKVVEWFESHGVPIKCEEDMRVFPISNSGADVIGAFQRIFDANASRCTLMHSTGIDTIHYIDNKYILKYKETSLEADFLVITTWGNAYAHTGSSGDGYNFARALGHKITPLGPSLSSFEVAENFPKEISGISLPKARLRWNAEIFTEGPLLFSHFGITGPAPFAFSSLVAFEKIDREKPLNIYLAPLAGWWLPEWDTHLEREAKTHSNREVRNILDMLPRRMVDTLGIAAILPNRILNQRWATLSKDDRKILAKVLGEGIPLTLVSRRAGDEFVTAGGVDTWDIDTETMESKILSWLYFAGEVLNIDGVTGGFNLQAAWCTGRVAWLTIFWNLSNG